MTDLDDRDSQPTWTTDPAPSKHTSGQQHPPGKTPNNQALTSENTGEQHTCDHGWIDRNADQPQPCLTCKPWLTTPTAPGAQPRKATP